MQLPYSPDHVAKIKSVAGRRWYAKEQHWTVPQGDGTLDTLLNLFPGKLVDVDPALGAVKARDNRKFSSSVLVPVIADLRAALQARHYSQRTEQAYGHWVARFLHIHQGRHPVEMAEADINRFLTHLAVTEQVSASTQNQALAALLFLYRHVMGRNVGDLGEVIRARKPQRLPAVMTREEVKAVLANLTGEKRLMASLMYGAGLRLMECLRLRVQNIDFSRNEILVRDGKGAKDRITMLPESLNAPLQDHVKQVKAIHEKDLADGGAASCFRTHSTASTPTRGKTGAGSGSSRRKPGGTIGRRAKKDGITFTRRFCNGPLRMLSAGPVWSSMPGATHSGIRSPRTSLRPGTTSGPSKHCSVTRTSAPP